MAAEALAADGLSTLQRFLLIQRLVPLSVADRTSLDTVAARLLMAVLPGDVAALEGLGNALKGTEVQG